MRKRRSTGVKLTVYVVDVVNSNLLVIHNLPAQRKLITHTVGKRQGFSNPADEEEYVSIFKIKNLRTFLLASAHKGKLS